MTHTLTCNRILVDDDRVCIVKDTCEGCDMDHERCAIDDLLEDTGTLESWRHWDMPNFRERTGE